jgi:hypothetical protein
MRKSIFWIANNEDMLLKVGILFLFIGIGGLVFGFPLLGIYSLMLFVTTIIMVDECVYYKNKKCKNIKRDKETW